MNVKLLPLLIAGTEIPQKRLNDRYLRARAGTLTVADETDQGRHRLMRVARFQSSEVGAMKSTLYDPQILWMNDGLFVLKGFQRVKVEDKLVEYAQSWLCFSGTEPPPPPKEKR